MSLPKMSHILIFLFHKGPSSNLFILFGILLTPINVIKYL